MNKIKYSLLFLGIISFVGSIVFVLTNTLNTEIGAWMFVIGFVLILIGFVYPTQLCEGLP